MYWPDIDFDKLTPISIYNDAVLWQSEEGWHITSDKEKRPLLEDGPEFYALPLDEQINAIIANTIPGLAPVNDMVRPSATALAVWRKKRWDEDGYGWVPCQTTDANAELLWMWRYPNSGEVVAWIDNNGVVPSYVKEISAAWRVFILTMDPNRTSIHPCGNGADGLWWAVYYDNEMVAYHKAVEVAICIYALKMAGAIVEE